MKIEGWQKETDILKVDCQKLRQEHEQLNLMTTNQTLEDTIKKLSLSEESLKVNNLKSEVLDTGLPTFTTLMAIFTFVSTSLEDNSRTVQTLVFSNF